MIKEHPILFKTEMVKAILEGRKTMTRRVVNNDDLKANPDLFRFIDSSYEKDIYRRAIRYDDRIWYEWQLKNSNASCWLERCRWKKGDLLWVKETWQALRLSYDWETGLCDEINVEKDIQKVAQCQEVFQSRYQFVYKSGSNFDEHFDDRGFHWKSPLFMPKSAARIWLEITNIKVERLQDISEEDAKAEGVTPAKCCAAYYHGFSLLWQSINGEENWNNNPFVWVIEFKRIDESKCLQRIH